MRRIVMEFPEETSLADLNDAEGELFEFCNALGLPCPDKFYVESVPDDGFADHMWVIDEDHKIVLLESHAEYKAEGRLMRNAVELWYGRPDNRILSLRNDVGTPLLTFELQPSARRILSMRGPSNVPATPEQRALVYAWAISLGIEPLPDGVNERA